MKIYKFITQISIAGCMLVGTPMLQGCMDNSLNDPLGKVSEEELGRDGFAANAFFLTLCDYTITFNPQLSTFSLILFIFSQFH